MKMKVLAIVSDRVLPAVTATRVRNFFLWPALQKLGVEVKILGINLDRKENHPQGPPGIACEFIKHRKTNILNRTYCALTKSFQEWPRSQELLKRVMDIQKEWRPDIIHAEEMRMGYYLPGYHLMDCEAKQTITFHNVESELLRMTGSSPFTFGKSIIEFFHQQSLKDYERKCAEVADLCFAFSQVDLKKYSNLYPLAHWGETSNGTDVKSLKPSEQVASPQLLIVGSLRYAPNIKGLNWFLDQVWPQIEDEFELTVAGSNARPEVRERLAKEKLTFVDTPESLTPHYENCALCVVPVFEGSGTRTKILESLALERMVLTTDLGVEGLPLNETMGVVIAAPDHFVTSIRQWGIDPLKRRTPAQRGREFVLENFDWSIVAKSLINSWEDLK